MAGNQLNDIDKLEDSLWEAADLLRQGSKLTSSEYCMPVHGVIFLQQPQIETTRTAGVSGEGTVTSG